MQKRVPCDTCNRRKDCLALSSCLELLSGISDGCENQETMSRYHDFIKRINETGYSYPYGEICCTLAENSTPLDVFLKESRALFMELAGPVES